MNAFYLADSKQIDPIFEWLNQHVLSSALLQADSRAIQEGDVFCAYSAEGVDNHAFVHEACQRGAKAVLYSDVNQIASSLSVPSLHVPFLGQLLGGLASTWYDNDAFDGSIIGVTGTNGKTSCSQWIAYAFQSLKKPCAIVGTLGCGMPGDLHSTGFTTPDACRLQYILAQCIEQGAQAVAMEVSSHALQQGRVNGVPFKTAIFTNLTQDHLDYHHSFENYELAKARLFQWPSLQNVIINRDDPAGQRLLASIAAPIKVVEYGFSEAEPIVVNSQRQYVFAKQVSATAQGVSFKIESSWGVARVNSPMIGQFNIANLLAVFAVLMVSDIGFEEAVSALRRLQPVLGRMQQLGGNAHQNEPLVVIDYAHTPNALEQALLATRSIAQVRQGQLHCVFGCGGERDKGKRPLMGKIATRLADHVMVTSDNPRGEAPLAIIEEVVADLVGLDVVEDRARAILNVIKQAKTEDVILIAGKGHENIQAVKGEEKHFSDQEHALLALAMRITQVKRGES